MTNEPNKPNFQSIQDVFLNTARKSGTPVSIHVTNGFMIKNAIIISFDNYAVLVEADGKQMMVYKHAISTITPTAELSL